MTIHRNFKFILDSRIYDEIAMPVVDVAHFDHFHGDSDDSDVESDCYSDDSSLGILNFDDDEVISGSVASYINALFPSVDYRHGENDEARILQIRLEALIEQLSRDDERSQEASKSIDDDDSLVLTRRLRSPSLRKEKRNSSLGDSLHIARCNLPTVPFDGAEPGETRTENDDDEDDDDFSEYFIALKDHSSQSSESPISRSAGYDRPH